LLDAEGGGHAEANGMEDIVQIPVPLPHIRSVNTWLLRGDPLTLVDTGPHADDALAALEAGLRRAGARIEDVERVLLTHHHLDHSGLAATIAARSGATVAALDRAADYGEHYAERSEADRQFSHALMRHHGVPDAAIDGNETFWDFIRQSSDAWRTDIRLSEGDRIRAGGRDLRVVARPGHSTTDTLFVDDRDNLAFVGDHLLASISSNTEIYPAAEPDGTRPRARVEYLQSLRRTAAMPLDRLLSGHGEAITAHAALVEERFGQHERRCERILKVLEGGPATAYAITRQLWSQRTVAEQPLLVVWEVLGHLDLLLDAGAVTEQATDDGSRHSLASFALAAAPTTAPATHRPGFRLRDPRNHEPPGGGGHARTSRHAHRRC
jgi:glyoxylase-like metal-dependent hydrolase (beta-lactamase superfamily II)